MNDPRFRRDLPTRSDSCPDLEATPRRTVRRCPVYAELPVDVALLVDEATKVADVEQFLRTTGRKQVRSVALFEVYRGDRLPAGRKSLNFTVTLGADDRTLTDQHAAKFLGKVRDNVAQIGGELRE